MPPWRSSRERLMIAGATTGGIGGTLTVALGHGSLPWWLLVFMLVAPAGVAMLLIEAERLRRRRS